MKGNSEHRLAAEEAARISAAYGVLVRPEVTLQRVPPGEGVLWHPVPLRAQRAAMLRKHWRDRRVARARAYDPDGQP